MFIRKCLAAKAAIFIALAIAGTAAPAVAGIPVIDAANLSQTVVAAAENVAQTIKQIEQYQTQLQQYENMLKNTAAPAAYIWDKATGTINKLLGAVDTLNYYKNSLGSVDKYLAKFQNASFYKSSPCFTAKGCSEAEWTAIKEVQRLGSEAQKKANDAMFKGLEQQQKSIEDDAAQLEKLQAGAQGAEGQMQALGFANQLASHQASQLLQMRAMLASAQNAIATRNQVLVDREALQQAKSEKLYAVPGASSSATNKGF
jgi:P-type conjugative transfer protein TrbJ